MKHSGLQKSISSIFDGAPSNNQDTSPASAPRTPAGTVSPAPQPAQPSVVASVMGAASTLPLETSPKIPAVSSVGYATPTAAPRPAARPRPVSRKKMASGSFSLTSLWTRIKARLSGSSKNAMNSRQKKTLVLGGVLAVVFVAVLLFAFGYNPSSAKAAAKKTGDGAAADSKSSVDTKNWAKPEIYPLSLRDPMSPSSNASSGSRNAGEMTVRGIVYSSTKPSAIIADQIVFEGDVILGVKIVKIEKDSVIFEKDEKRWQQQVMQ